MKKKMSFCKITIFLSLIVIFGCNKKLEEKNGIYYLIGEKIPFTGTVINNFKTGNAFFENGKLVEEIDFYKNKKVKERNFHKNNEREYIQYYENGKLQEKGFYKNGKREGEVIWYYESGNIKGKCIYLKGYLNGELTLYKENGEIEKQEIIKMERRGYDDF